MRTINTELYALGETDLPFYLLLAQSESALCGLTWPYIVATKSGGDSGEEMLRGQQTSGNGPAGGCPPGWPERQVSSEVPIPVVLGMGFSNDKEECCQFSGALLWFTEEGISPDSHILKDLLINREAKSGSLVFGLCKWPRA